MAVELLEQLATTGLRTGVERWLANDGTNVPRIALIAVDDDVGWNIAQENFELWVGITHPAFAAHLACGRTRDRRLFLIHEDDRGPTLATAAGWIESPIDRERWAAAQIASLCDGITMMGHRFRGFVHRRAGDPFTFVDTDGAAHLRAYLDQGTYNAMNRRGPFYLSPEQIAMDLLTPASDVFTLGVTLYAALDGTHPFARGEAPLDRYASIVRDPTPAPPRTTSPQLAQILQIALAKRPADRFAEPSTFAALLRQHVPPVARSVYDEVAAALRSQRG